MVSANPGDDAEASSSSAAPLALRPPAGRLGGRLGRTVVAALPPLVIAAIVVVVVAPGLMPDVGYWDTGEFQTVLPILGTAHPTGYPTYVLLGYLVNILLAPLGEPAFRMNVLSLLCVAAAAAATVRLVERLTGVLLLGMAAGIGVALTPDAWRLATHADPHTLHLALVAILFGLLVRWEIAHRTHEDSADRWLVAATVVFGLSVGNHSLTLLLALPVSLFVLATEPTILFRPKMLAACAIALVGTVVGVYLELPLRAGPFRAPLVYANPVTWNGFWYVALAEQFRGSIHDPFGNLAGKLGDLVMLAQAQFGYLSILIPLGFLATAVRHWRYAVLTGSAMLITVFFNASYTNADISRYYLGPILWAWTWLAVLGAVAAELVLGVRLGEDARPSGTSDGEVLEERGRGAGPGTWTRLGAPGFIVSAALGLVLLVPTVTDFRTRASAADLSTNHSARDWLDAALMNVAPDAVIVSWWSTSTTLWYAQYVDHLRPDLMIVDDRTRLDLNYGEATDVIARFLGSRPVYVIRANPYDLGLVTARYALSPLPAPASNVYRVLGPIGAGG